MRLIAPSPPFFLSFFEHARYQRPCSVFILMRLARLCQAELRSCETAVVTRFWEGTWPSRVLSALVSTGRATGHAHIARLRSDLLRLDTTATRTRQAAASDRHRAKKKNVPPRVAVRIDRRPESVLTFFRISPFSCIRFSPPVDRKITLLLGVIFHRHA